MNDVVKVQYYLHGCKELHFFKVLLLLQKCCYWDFIKPTKTLHEILSCTNNILIIKEIAIINIVIT